MPHDNDDSPALQAGNCSGAGKPTQARTAWDARKIPLARAKVRERDSTFSQLQRRCKTKRSEGEEVQVVSRAGRRAWETRQSSHDASPAATETVRGSDAVFFALERTDMNERRMQLKICEGCGRIWLRDQGTNHVYCQRCDVHLGQYPEPGSRRQRRRAHAVGWKTCREQVMHGQDRGEA